MNDITGFLESLEKLAYRLLMWVILFPKTLLKIILDPTWVPEYVKGELQPEKKSPFNEYVSPVLFFVSIVLIPSLFLPYLPTQGVNLTSEVVRTRWCNIHAEVTFQSHSPDLRHEFWWVISSFDEDTWQSNYVAGESHFRYGVLPLNYQDEKIIRQGALDESLIWMEEPVRIVDDRLVTDQFSFYFGDLPPGSYTVEFRGAYFEKDSEEPIEAWYDSRGVMVPEDPQTPIEIMDDYYSAGGSDETREALTWDTFLKSLQNNNTYLLALGFLSLPLIFALLGRGFHQENIGEDSLRASFYAQCYLFSPLGAAYWANTYADRFITPDVFFSNPSLYGYEWQLIQFPLLATGVWFFIVEVSTIARERNTRKWKAFLILLLCLLVLLGVFVLLNLLSNSPYLWRVSALRIYIAASLLLFSGMLLGWIWRVVKKRKRERK